MTPRTRRTLRATLITTAATTAVTALALSAHTGTRTGITVAAALLGLTLVALGLELRLRTTRKPQAPLDAAYHTQPRAYRHHDHNHDDQ